MVRGRVSAHLKPYKDWNMNMHTGKVDLETSLRVKATGGPLEELLCQETWERAGLDSWLRATKHTVGPVVVYRVLGSSAELVILAMMHVSWFCVWSIAMVVDIGVISASTSTNSATAPWKHFGTTAPYLAQQSETAWERRQRWIMSANSLFFVAPGSKDVDEKDVSKHLMATSFIVSFSFCCLSDTMRSIYKQLGQGETIRVLKIARSVAQTDQLYGSLQVVKLQERPKYQALSYVWGPRGQHDPIVLIDNCPFQISTSLFQAFLKLTIGASPVTLWVDQICINQLDNAEKQQQVRLMSRIYQQADQVICWLGVQENNSDIAFKLLRILNLSDGMYEAYNDLVAGGYARSPADLFSPSNTLGKAVALLFQRSWFERLWIVQEVALANRVLVHCGACSMEGQL
ncbi:MFS allantoate transporter [Beauveria bassiana ARSEF 2860]|uniref:MFS allantoate transporter n=1 Tax=Beauveria bassiana (strain ARSEF 2860) TaxID=655819 RepID=J4VRZ5_BEAB2|nr:MFS allantoate transporter [Beauveria bassiana ARSEF 2860]EJP61380.1 MFS allantoate transporter [Beauveria bassiana ARSEF 2860]